MSFDAGHRSAASGRRARRALLAIGVVVVAACGSDTIIGVPVDGRSQDVTAAVGQEIDVTLWNPGPGAWATPPTISSSTNVLTYVDVVPVPAVDSTGPLQRFRFRAAAPGMANVTFQRMSNDSVVAEVVDRVTVH